jgi:hypothetical protein
MAAMLAYAQSADEGYQMARVVSFERVAANAQHMGDSDHYKILHALGRYGLRLPRQRPGCRFY